MNGDEELDYEVITSPSIPLALPGRMPEGGVRTWAPLSTTLIMGRQDAVLVDPPLTAAQAEIVARRIRTGGRRLTDIFVTHGHGDHWFTAAMLTERFPGSRVVATSGTMRQMHRTAQARAGFWDRILPGQIPSSPVTAIPVERFESRIFLEGHELLAVDVGHSDSDDTSVLHVVDLDLVLAGDVVYDGVHQYLVESGGGGRDSWRRAIDRVEAIGAHRVVAGHRADSRDRNADRIIAETRRYLDDVDGVLDTEPTPEGFFTAMRQRYPRHLNESSLWGSSQALYAGG